jgi:nitrogen-specific signal transduction histidine kinase
MKTTKPGSRVADVLTFPRMSQRGDGLLQSVLNNLLQGVLMFDADARLAFCNPRYIEMYGLSPDVAKPGCSLKELLGHQASVGGFAEDPDDYIALLKGKMAAGETFADTLHLADGRIHSVVSKPIEGGGWLATHEDVTERQRSEQRIAHMARHDALTDLPNRVLLRDVLEHELKRVKRGERLAVLCLDLDQFKGIRLSPISASAFRLRLRMASSPTCC